MAHICRKCGKEKTAAEMRKYGGKVSKVCNDCPRGAAKAAGGGYGG